MSDTSWALSRQYELDRSPTGSVRCWHDGSIAYRTNKPESDAEAWLIVRPDGTTIGAGLLTIADMPGLYQWFPMAAQPLPDVDYGEIDDGFGSTWSLCKPDCRLEIVRPGKVQCECENG